MNLARGQNLSGAVVALEGAARRGVLLQELVDCASEVDGSRSSTLLAALRLVNGKVESALEAYALGVFHTLGLPSPDAQLELSIRGNRYRPDFAWVDRRLVVEVDGEVKYQDRGEISYERRRQRELEAAGWRVIRVTWAELKDLKSPTWRLLKLSLGG